MVERSCIRKNLIKGTQELRILLLSNAMRLLLQYSTMSADRDTFYAIYSCLIKWRWVSRLEILSRK